MDRPGDGFMRCVRGTIDHGGKLKQTNNASPATDNHKMSCWAWAMRPTFALVIRTPL
jgi:hypothetical protein